MRRKSSVFIAMKEKFNEIIADRSLIRSSVVKGSSYSHFGHTRTSSQLSFAPCSLSLPHYRQSGIRMIMGSPLPWTLCLSWTYWFNSIMKASFLIVQPFYCFLSILCFCSLSFHLKKTFFHVDRYDRCFILTSLYFFLKVFVLIDGLKDHRLLKEAWYRKYLNPTFFWFPPSQSEADSQRVSSLLFNFEVPHPKRSFWWIHTCHLMQFHRKGLPTCHKMSWKQFHVVFDYSAKEQFTCSFDKNYPLWC